MMETGGTYTSALTNRNSRFRWGSNTKREQNIHFNLLGKFSIWNSDYSLFSNKFFLYNYSNKGRTNWKKKKLMPLLSNLSMLFIKPLLPKRTWTIPFIALWAVWTVIKARKLVKPLLMQTCSTACRVQQLVSIGLDKVQHQIGKQSQTKMTNSSECSILAHFCTTCSRRDCCTFITVCCNEVKKVEMGEVISVSTWADSGGF